MGLAQSQKLLARLFTDAALRDAFFADPRGIGSGFGLSGEEARRLAELSDLRVGQFASSLRHKRRLEVEKCLPLSRLVLGTAAFHGLFQRHTAEFLPAGVKKHRDDAVTFASLAEQAVRSGEIGPLWAADLLRYEAARLVATDPAQRVTVRWLRHSVTDLMLAHSKPDLPPPMRRTLALWFRAPRTGKLRHVLLALPAWPFSAKAAPHL